MSRPKRKSVTRNDFIKKFHGCGMTYRQATAIFEAVVDLVGTAVLNRQQVEFGRVGKIVPVLANSKTVSMNFPNRQRQIMLGRRIRFKFRVHKSFIDSHPIDWFS
jgi:nucleoid DNA-binding protein